MAKRDRAAVQAAAAAPPAAARDEEMDDEDLEDDESDDETRGSMICPEGHALPDDYDGDTCPECGATLVDDDGDDDERSALIAAMRDEQSGVRYRSFAVRIEAGDAATRAADDPNAPVPIALSSEYPVERQSFNWDTWERETYNEVLDHSPASVDLSRAKDGLPFMLSHATYSAREQVGIIENIRVDQDRVLRGEVRFSAPAPGAAVSSLATDAQQIRKDMLDQIRKWISVGYMIDENNLQRTQEKGDPIATVRCMRWTPMEASNVPVAADPTVGVGRSARSAATDVERLRERLIADPKFAKRLRRALRAPASGSPGAAPTPAARKAQEESVKETDTAAQGGAAPATVQATAGEDKAREHARTEQIRNLGKLFKLPEERVSEYVATGMDARDVGALLVAEAQQKLRAMSATIEMSDKEAKTYSVARAILGQLQSMRGVDAVPVDDSFEREVHQELTKNLPSNYRGHNGILMPTRVKVGGRGISENLIGRTIDTQSSTGAKGGNLIFKQPGEYIDFLWPRMKVAALGATRLSGLQGPVAFPKMTSASAWTWTGDNPGSDVDDSDPVFGQVALDPKEGQATSGFTRSALVQAASGNVDLEAKLQNNLFMAAALGIDLAAINGGGGNAPTGILGTSGIGSVADAGGNGSVPTRADMINLMTQVANANADIGPGGYLSTPGIRGVLMNVFATVGSTPVGLPVWDKDEVLGEPAEVSTQVPSTLTKGTASGICHAIIYGIWATLNIGYWGAYELVVDPYSKKKQGIIEVTNYQIVGVALEYASAFAAKKDAKLA